MGHGLRNGHTQGCRTLTLGTFLLALISTLDADCPADTGYPNGLVSLSDGLKEGSTAQFLCPSGQYPWPVGSRICQANGKWSIMRSSTGRTFKTITCKKMICPEPGEFENGEFSPRGPYYIGANITFRCHDGYTLRGSTERTCRRNARWSGETTVCDVEAGHCPDPGKPPGAVKTGTRYDIDDRVTYKCTRGLSLVGSDSRTCLENRRWSGTEVSCQYPYSFDLPEDVGEQFAASISGVLNVNQKQKSLGRTIKIAKDGILNVYLLLDASGSVGEGTFNISKECALLLVRGLSEFDMKIQFGILSYATSPFVVIQASDDKSQDARYVMDLINTKLTYSGHKDKTGTNIKAALEQVYAMMVLQEQRYADKNKWNSIHHVIILLTDGKANMGGRPVDTIKRINEFLDIKRNRSDYLDVYAFGIGTENVDMTELRDIASKKDSEKHAYVMKDAEDMKKVFQKILEIKNYGDMCGLNDESPGSEKSFHHPWNVLIQSTQRKDPCLGSLISKSWVLSAAHCFKEDVPADKYSLEIGDLLYKVKKIEIHDCYNLRRKNAIGVEQDYDYDVALIKLDKSVKFSKSARPICIPCTESANRAMKKSKGSTCQEHWDHLMKTAEEPASYLSKSPQDPSILNELRVFIQNKQARDSCVSAVRTWTKFKDIDPSLLVSPRHLCVKGEMSCKGESGGSLFVDLRERRRFFQVGVLSFGLFNPCPIAGVRNPPPPGSEPRDFHISIYEVLPWLRKHLDEELTFLSDIPPYADIKCPD
ncbi:complement C2-like [Rhinophrynus dorsalis]